MAQRYDLKLAKWAREQPFRHGPLGVVIEGRDSVHAEERTPVDTLVDVLARGAEGNAKAGMQPRTVTTVAARA